MYRSNIARRLGVACVAAILGIVVLGSSSEETAEAGGGTFFLTADPTLIFPGDSLDVDVEHQGSTIGAFLSIQYDPTLFVFDGADSDFPCVAAFPGQVNCPVFDLFGLPQGTLASLSFSSNGGAPPGPTGMDLIVEDCSALRATQGADPECPGFGTPIHILSIAPLPHTWGDVDCDQSTRIGDAQKIARTLIALPVSQQQPCPGVGHFATFGQVPRQLGDVDCNSQFTIGDAQKLARSLIGLPITQDPGCPELGEVLAP